MIRTAPHTARAASVRRAAPFADSIEWEDLPSFADSLPQRLVVLGSRSVAAQVEAATGGWHETEVSELDALPPSEPFRETLAGLSTREVHEPEVFRLFFGR